MASSLFETVGIMAWNLIIPMNSRRIEDSFIDAPSCGILSFAIPF